MGAQDIQQQDGSAQRVAGQVRGAEGPAQLAGFLFPSGDLKGRRRQCELRAGGLRGAGGSGRSLCALGPRDLALRRDRRGDSSLADGSQFA